MDCDAGSSRGEGFRRGDSAPGLPRGVGFGSRAGGSGSLRSPFVDVDSPSLPMVDASSARALGDGTAGGSGSAARGGERLSGGVRSTTAARWRASGAQRLGRGRVRARGGWTSGQYFSHDGVGRSCRVSTELSALKAIMRHWAYDNVGLALGCQTFSCSRFRLTE